MGRTDDKLNELIIRLSKNGILMSDAFNKDLHKLVTSNVDDFIENFYKYITRTNFDYNKFECLGLTAKQRKQLSGYHLYRYEYRKESNFRCLYILSTTDSNDMTILLCAFNEIEGKAKGPNSYSSNIERAIRIFEDLNS